MLNNIYTAAKKNVKKELDRAIRIGSLSPDKIEKDTEYISFDIFDTLIVRDVNQPTDVFRLMEIKTGIKNFAARRIRAERNARAMARNGEVTITEIYREFAGIKDEQISSLCALELSTEMGLCHAQPEMLRFYNTCRQRYKVILASDMYLPFAMMTKLLKHCGIAGYEKLYVSCETGCSKGGRGELYEYICKDLGISANRITHIGNDISSDVLRAKQRGLHVIKVRTDPSRLISRAECPKEAANHSQLQKSMLYHFLNNTTHDPGKDYDFYYRFGYENFGVLLWSFCKWLHERMKEDGIEQVLFVARDGYMIKKVYDKLYGENEIPSRYFEMSRRSIRVAASFSHSLSYLSMLRLMPLPSRASIDQIFDAWGLPFEKYTDLCDRFGIGRDEIFWTKNLMTEDRVKQLYYELKDEIIDNAKEEYHLMLAYTQQFDLEKKTAFVDIGWGATIQKELLKALHTAGVNSDLHGYYMALDKRTADNLGELSLSAKGYLWDNYNGSDDIMEEKTFSGIYETFFLEKNGSVKRYIRSGDRVIAERYPYEYHLPGGLLDETSLVNQIQNGAMDFVNEVVKCEVGKQKQISADHAFCFMRDCLMEPSTEMIRRFGDFRFFNSGDQTYLARPKRSLIGYGLHPRDAIADFYESQWKTGFFKALFKADISYEKLCFFLKRLFPVAPV